MREIHLHCQTDGRVRLRRLTHHPQKHSHRE
jgi:hypothetical protein